MCGFFLKLEREEQAFVSLEEEQGPIWQYRGGPEPPNQACQPTYGLQRGLQDAVTSRGQARCRGLTLSTSWSLCVYHGHLCDTEPGQPMAWLVSPGRFITPALRLGPGSAPSVGVRSPHSREEQGYCGAGGGPTLPAPKGAFSRRPLCGSPPTPTEKRGDASHPQAGACLR